MSEKIIDFTIEKEGEQFHLPQISDPQDLEDAFPLGEVRLSGTGKNLFGDKYLPCDGSTLEYGSTDMPAKADGTTFRQIFDGICYGGCYNPVTKGTVRFRKSGLYDSTILINEWLPYETGKHNIYWYNFNIPGHTSYFKIISAYSDYHKRIVLMSQGITGNIYTIAADFSSGVKSFGNNIPMYGVNCALAVDDAVIFFGSYYNDSKIIRSADLNLWTEISFSVSERVLSAVIDKNKRILCMSWNATDRGVRLYTSTNKGSAFSLSTLVGTTGDNSNSIGGMAIFKDNVYMCGYNSTGGWLFKAPLSDLNDVTPVFVIDDAPSFSKIIASDDDDIMIVFADNGKYYVTRDGESFDEYQMSDATGGMLITDVILNETDKSIVVNSLNSSVGEYASLGYQEVPDIPYGFVKVNE